jgi:hypothetical protein
MQHALSYVQRIEQRLSRTFMTDLFLMLIEDERLQPSTATEIEEKKSEKVLQLGPVVEAIQLEMLKPLVQRTFRIMARQGLLPDPPDELVHGGGMIKVEFQNIFAQAQKMTGVAALERNVMFAAQLAAAWPEALDKIDVDEVVEIHADMLGGPPKVLRSEEDLARLRRQKAEAAAAQQAAAAAGPAQQYSQAAKNLSQSDMTSDSALSRIMSGYQPTPAA